MFLCAGAFRCRAFTPRASGAFADRLKKTAAGCQQESRHPRCKKPFFHKQDLLWSFRPFENIIGFSSPNCNYKAVTNKNSPLKKKKQKGKAEAFCSRRLIPYSHSSNFLNFPQISRIATAVICAVSRSSTFGGSPFGSCACAAPPESPQITTTRTRFFSPAAFT